MLRSDPVHATKLSLTEHDVTALCVSYFKANGWVPYRKNVGMLRDGDRVARFGKPGECDWLFIRPLTHPLGPAFCEIEMKRSDITMSASNAEHKKQLEYIALRNHMGIPATWVNSLEMLKQWLTQRGLDRELAA